MRIVALIVLLILVLYIVGQVLRTQMLIHVGERLAADAIPFSRKLDTPTLRILVIGDSTAVGTGASSPSTTLAGLVGQRYPTADILNAGVNGARTADVVERFKSVAGQFDLILIHSGGNDIVHGTSYEQLAKDVRSLLDIAVTRGKHVLLTTSGNVGTAPLFPSLTRWIFEGRTRSVRAMFMRQVAQTKGDVRYTDLFREREVDPFALDPKKYYAADSFHPSDAGYQDWFGFMAKQLDTFGL